MTGWREGGKNEESDERDGGSEVFGPVNKYSLVGQ